MKKEKLKKLFWLDVAFAAGYSLLYTNGVIGLGIAGAGLLQGAVNLLLGIAAPAGLVVYNGRTILSRPAAPKLIGTSQYSREKLQQELRHYLGNCVFGQVARSCLDELDKCEKLQKGIEDVLARKFDKGSLTYQKYETSVSSAQNAILDNIVDMLGRMQLVDATAYSRLQNYKHDDIPDDVQLKQLDQYNRNIETVKDMRNRNEEIICKLNELSLELAASVAEDSTGSKTCEEIDTLIRQLDFYKNN